MAHQVTLKHVNYTYGEKTTVAHQALRDVSLTVEQGDFVTIIGTTGSGKSTLIKLLNGLQFAQSGTVEVLGVTLRPKVKAAALKQLRSQVGLVFQSPEQQLFADNVLQDVQFGPLNFGASSTEAEQQARASLDQVGIPVELLDRSPFELSGGQMRRVAIAGVLASQPRVLVLDEPTVGLDGRGRRSILEMLRRLNQEQHITIIMITHEMDIVARYAQRVVVMKHGRIEQDTTPRQFFQTTQNQFVLPGAVRVGRALQANGVDLDQLPLTRRELVESIVHRLAKGGTA
ncbi:energy-coupling factor transporter ATPase [Fructilactobacillus cliffordii]|uniref:Energy-coupling factor transporter ATP-binding protein EcfA2 n=1 Tax=Fructilactobacillus cliffordii TaxID=2940299 RepID=A0A9Q8ZU73_9LACO|nr:energy-coupling factor transporter ATPase [Fructilactobacillus cliffordii]USS86289.1 energy-coupling factor transporter ATPase [Fructilactobacillus cliffordii]USS89357.1 energy-coupling factor transporter ATPase [Fructilactobacillus cliffordii]